MSQKISRIIIVFGLVLVSLISWQPVQAATAPTLVVPSGLSLAEIKITGNEYILLQNNTGATISDLSQYWLYGFNNTNPLAAGTNSSSQQLPSASLASGQTVMLSSVGGATCGAAVTSKLSISLGDSGGYLEVIKTEMSNNVLLQTAGDAVSWSSGVNTVPGMISKVPSNTTSPNGAWYRYRNSLATPPYLWQQADLSTTNSCQLNIVVSGVTVSGPVNPGNQLLPALPPPATIVSLPSSADSSSNTIANIGLMKPQLTELLPNPASPQTDAKDEFIEIYNSNNANFDLSGFKLQVASSNTATKHTYTFPSGTIIAAKNFAAYPSSNISASLNNSGGMVWLLDSTGAVVSQTETYSTAKDGQAWALANGKWYWTASPTPGAANVISATTNKKTSSGSGVGTVQAASTQTPNGNSSSITNSTGSTKARSLNSAVLVAVGSLAVVYGLYEYRRDLANAVHKFKRNRTIRRENRPKT